jgi:hypothetical protein
VVWGSDSSNQLTSTARGRSDVTSPERLTELHQALLDLSPDHKSVPPYFQVLLETTVENYISGKASLVGVRVIPIERLSGSSTLPGFPKAS